MSEKTENHKVAAITRFAPSPTGHLHLGHAYSALFAAGMAQRTGGKFLLRIEDIDVVRCRNEFEESIMEDLAWIGLEWEKPVRRQSECLGDYADALEKLREMGLLYPCFCTRKDIRKEIEGAANAPHGPDGPVYPGICRNMGDEESRERMARGDAFALRLNMEKAVAIAGELTWIDRGMSNDGHTIRAEPGIFGDVVLARKDTPTSYHLACSVDDHIQGVSLVTRGKDLFAATHLHRLLQELLGLDTPDYHHHELVRNEHGDRLAKRDRSSSLRAMREAGETPDKIRKILDLSGRI